MATGLRIQLNWQEAQALKALSASELRDPRDQARIIIRCELERCGLLKATPPREPDPQPLGSIPCA